MRDTTDAPRTDDIRRSAAGVAGGLRNQATSATSKPERPVLVSKVEFRSENGSRDFAGVVRARHEIDLGFRVAGKVVARTSMSAIASVPAMWWRNSTRRTRSCKPRARRPNSRAATSNLSQAAADLARYTTLNARGYASLADFDRKKAANDEARKAASIVP